MDLGKLIEKLSLDLLVSGKIDKSLLEPTLSEIRQHLPEQLKSLGDELHSLCRKGGSKNYDTVLKVVENLSAQFQKTTTQTESAPVAPAAVRQEGELRYDTSHGIEILESFFAEVSSHLESIEAGLIHLEKRATDKEALKTVFGALHSLKGIMGFLDVKAGHELTHAAEALIELARDRASGISRNECDAILRTVDILRNIQGLIFDHSRLPNSVQQPFPATPDSCAAMHTELQRMAQQATADVAAEATSDEAQNAALHEHDPRGETRILDQGGIVRVKVEKLDALLDTIGELVVTQTQVHQDPSLHRVADTRLQQNLTLLNKITRDLQSIAMTLRMFPIKDTFGRMTRLARDLAHGMDKDVEIVTVGDETEMDKNVIEALTDPLSHLIRNAIDHGVDHPDDRLAAGKSPQAQVILTARHQGSSVIVEVRDDGRGLDFHRIEAKARQNGMLGIDEPVTEDRLRQIIFEPGFSTAEKVTGISGRGVGMDVVKRHVESLGGRVTVQSVPGQFTVFTLTLPLTLAIIDGLVVRMAHERYIVPITSVVESLKPKREQLSTVQQRGELINVRGQLLPLVRLSEFTRGGGDVRDPWNGIVMIVECGGEQCGLLVDELLGQQQVVIKNLGDRLRSVKGVSGGAILGDGRVGLILDTAEILTASRNARSRVHVA